MKISQQTYIETLAAEYKVTWSRSVPLSVTCRLWEFDSDEPDVDKPFRQFVGSLLWVARLTRPDLLNAVRAVARYCSSPRMVHWLAALDILAYANATSSFGISFQKGTVEGLHLIAFADADFASNATDRRSVSGGLVIMCAGGPISCFSRTQNCVTTSTTQAEYVLAWLR